MKSILTILLLLSLQTLFSQSIDQNANKYWNYRTRLKQYFLKVGPGKGESLPVSIRNRSGYNGPANLDMGDCPDFLGYYIGVLATEYKLLNDKGLDVSETAKELYYALYAFNRLDLCEHYYNGNSQLYPYADNNKYDDVLDGFFIQDDAGRTFNNTDGLLDKHPELNQRLNGSILDLSNICTDKPGFVNSITSSKCTGLTENPFLPGNKGYMDDDPFSKDYVSQMFIGLALVRACVPPSANFNQQKFQNWPGHPDNIYFVAEASRIAQRIIEMWIRNDWWPKTPRGVLTYKDYARNFLLSYGFVRAAGYIIQDEAIAQAYEEQSIPSLVGKPFWRVLGFTNRIDDNLLAFPDKVCNMLPPDIQIELECGNRMFANKQDFSVRIMVTLAAIADSWINTKKKINEWEKFYNWSPFYEMLLNILHNKRTIDNTSWLNLEQLLNIAPCEGPSKFGTTMHTDITHHCPTTAGTPFWNAQKKFSASMVEQINGSKWNGNFNGLDYMLMFNMYYLLFGNSFDKNYYSPYLNNQVYTDNNSIYPAIKFFPPPNTNPYFLGLMPATNNFVNITIPYEKKVVGSISSNSQILNNTIYNPSQFTTLVIYNATNSIRLQPGFKVQKGANFKAVIRPISCIY